MSTQTSNRIWLARAGRVSGPYEPAQFLGKEDACGLAGQCQVRPEGQQEWMSYGAWRARVTRQAAQNETTPPPSAETTPESHLQRDHARR